MTVPLFGGVLRPPPAVILIALMGAGCAPERIPDAEPLASARIPTAPVASPSDAAEPAIAVDPLPAPVEKTPARSASPTRQEPTSSDGFSSAVLFKPRDDAAIEWLADLAPLIVEQVPDGTTRAMIDGFFGAMILNDDNMLEVDLKQPTVMVDMREVDHGGLTYRQLSFGWVYAWSKTQVSARSICLTLAPDGFPCVWELGDAEGAGTRTLFLSQSFEALCLERFGPPLSNRRFAAELAAGDAAGARIAGLIEDGPMPLGPYVYLKADTHEITNVTCRCSPSMVEAFIDTRDYVLKPRFSGDFGWRTVAPAQWPWSDPWDVLRWPYGPDSESAPPAQAHDED